MFKKKFTKFKHQTGWFPKNWQASLPLIVIILLVWIYAAAAQPLTPTEISTLKQELKQELQVGLDTMWVVLAGCLVFFMNAGFAMLEAGFCRPKNTVSILTKNLTVFAIATVAFWSLGFGLMFGFGGDWTDPTAIDNGFMGLHGFFLKGFDNSPAIAEAYEGVFRSLNWTGIPLEAKFFFQLVFSGTAATVVSGAVAERIKFPAFVLFSFFHIGIIYPLIGHWIWGGGWLSKLGFWDFAGSTVVHSTGGWAALVGAVKLGARLGKYKNGNSLALPGHSLTISTLGCLILWLGWFGFNPGSTMAAEPRIISHVILVTNMAAVFGGIAATITSWQYFGKPDLSVIINGILAGLVSITAGCRFVGLGGAVVIGIVAGVIIVFSVDFFDRLEIDDPVGAISVHLIGGIWGTVAVGLFSVGPYVNLAPNFILYEEGPARGLLVGGGMVGLQQTIVQILGAIAVGIFTIVLSWLAWLAIKATIGLRVSVESELRGLDISEHGLRAYSGFLLRQEATRGSDANRSQENLPPSSS